MSQYAVVIGMEIHAELTTESKLFCRCPNTSHDLDTPPNTAVCPVCLGLPGALPVLNQKAVESTVKLGKSLGSTIPDVTKWDRKNYFYPDLPKSYQLSQYDQPICQGGVLSWHDREGRHHEVALTRIHLEEDTGKLVHPPGANYSLIDYNRSSIPLLELVSEPYITSAEEAKQFAEEYQHRLRELGVAEASMEKGQMRCEANISIVPEEHIHDPKKRLSGTKIEIKNLNSFRSMERAILYEIERQTNVLNEGGMLRQETRGWNDAKGETYVMRTKETADDYRYFPDPDLGAFDLREIKASVTQHSSGRQALFTELLQSGIDPKHVHTVTGDPVRRAYIESVSITALSPELVRMLVQWITQDSAMTRFAPEELTQAAQRVLNGEVSTTLIKEASAHSEPGNLLSDLSRLAQEHRVDNLDEVIAQVLSQNNAEVTRYRAGEEKLFGFFLGQIRKALQGKGDPTVIAEALKKQLG